MDAFAGLRRAVFIDRDGVINRTFVKENGKAYPPPSLAEFEFLPGVMEAVQALKRGGYVLVVATNQPDVGRGIQSLAVVEAMHAKIFRELGVDAIQACYHTREQVCNCRKPLPGMLFDAAQKLSIDLARSFMVGDRWSDVEAGRAAGCKTFMIGTGYVDEQTAEPDWKVASLLEASAIILRG